MSNKKNEDITKVMFNVQQEIKMLQKQFNDLHAHRIQEKPKERRQHQPYAVVCYRCGVSGHIAKDCRIPAATINNKTATRSNLN